jgi:hypothetical protein
VRGISIIILLGLIPPALGQAAGAPPVIHFTIYAPPQQPPPPIDAPERKAPAHIVGFENDRTEIRYVVSNDSDKPVIGVAIAYFGAAPEKCRTEPGTWESGANSSRFGGFLVRIAPHGRGVTYGIGDPLSGSLRGQTVHDAKPTLRAAQRLRAAYLQVQVGVFGVWYEDGSTWPAHWLGDTPPGRAGPFDASLIEAEAGKCTDVATVANALQSVEEIVFGPETPPASDPDVATSAIPHIRFSCSLEGSKAVCRLPCSSGDCSSPMRKKSDPSLLQPHSQQTPESQPLPSPHHPDR